MNYARCLKIIFLLMLLTLSSYVTANEKILIPDGIDSTMLGIDHAELQKINLAKPMMGSEVENAKIWTNNQKYVAYFEKILYAFSDDDHLQAMIFLNENHQDGMEMSIKEVIQQSTKRWGMPQKVVMDAMRMSKTLHDAVTLYWAESNAIVLLTITSNLLENKHPNDSSGVVIRILAADSEANQWQPLNRSSSNIALDRVNQILSGQ